jgi:hypothetical protein
MPVPALVSSMPMPSYANKENLVSIVMHHYGANHEPAGHEHNS